MNNSQSQKGTYRRKQITIITRHDSHLSEALDYLDSRFTPEELKVIVQELLIASFLPSALKEKNREKQADLLFISSQCVSKLQGYANGIMSIFPEIVQPTSAGQRFTHDSIAADAEATSPTRSTPEEELEGTQNNFSQKIEMVDQLLEK